MRENKFYIEGRVSKRSNIKTVGKAGRVQVRPFWLEVSDGFNMGEVYFELSSYGIKVFNEFDDLIREDNYLRVHFFLQSRIWEERGFTDVKIREIEILNANDF